MLFWEFVFEAFKLFKKRRLSKLTKTLLFNIDFKPVFMSVLRSGMILRLR